MNTIISAESVGKEYGGRKLFSGVTLRLRRGDSLCLRGPNGSGKTTLLRILSCQLPPTRGLVEYFSGDSRIDRESVFLHVGMAGPSIEPYGELTALENIDFVSRGGIGRDGVDRHLRAFGLFEHRNTALNNFSTGMKQRLRYILATINEPSVIFLDEPGANLDEAGKRMIYGHIESQRGSRITVIATNDRREERLCREVVTLGG
ncbi:MAG: ABC transporter ATP-binding protein [Spirochaetes bacterium]|nr:ABC transporter ATP-binding protein [Spirochaetota bacterium]